VAAKGGSEVSGGPLGFDPDDDEPRPGDDAPEVAVPGPPGTGRYVWFVGVVAVLLLAYVTVNTIRTNGPGSRGVGVGQRMPPFAAPLALSSLQGDVNVARKPNQGDAGNVPACRLRRPDVLNICHLYEQGPVVLVFMATRGKQCTRQLDVIEHVRGAHPGVQFAAVAIRGDRNDLRDLVRRHGWGFPVAYDHDGILANIYGVAVCPQIAYALPGGRMTATSFGEVDPVELERRVRALERAARRRGWTAPKL
jgi:hypothetical protein